MISQRYDGREYQIQVRGSWLSVDVTTYSGWAGSKRCLWGTPCIGAEGECTGQGPSTI